MSQEVTTDTFDTEVLQSEQPVIVDFWAEWCGPCRAVEPVIEKIAEERDGTIKVVKVNIDEEPALAQRYGIMSIPAIVLFKGGDHFIPLDRPDEFLTQLIDHVRPLVF